jgi:hypothetical protein
VWKRCVAYRVQHRHQHADRVWSCQLKIKHELIQEQSRSVTITESTVCRVPSCRRPIKNTAILRYPNGTVVHFACGRWSPLSWLNVPWSGDIIQSLVDVALSAGTTCSRVRFPEPVSVSPRPLQVHGSDLVIGACGCCRLVLAADAANAVKGEGGP